MKELAKLDNIDDEQPPEEMFSPLVTGEEVNEANEANGGIEEIVRAVPPVEVKEPEVFDYKSEAADRYFKLNAFHNSDEEQDRAFGIPSGTKYHSKHKEKRFTYPHKFCERFPHLQKEYRAAKLKMKLEKEEKEKKVVSEEKEKDKKEKENFCERFARLVKEHRAAKLKMKLEKEKEENTEENTEEKKEDERYMALKKQLIAELKHKIALEVGEVEEVQEDPVIELKNEKVEEVVGEEEQKKEEDASVMVLRKQLIDELKQKLIELKIYVE